MKRVQHAVKRLGWKRLGLGALIAAPILMVIAQFIYPLGNTMPYATIDSIEVGGLSRDDAIRTIETAYAETPLKVYFGEADEPYRSPTLGELGVSVDSAVMAERVTYQWWLRLVPTSLWWAHLTVSDEAPAAQLSAEAITAYAEKELGESCKVEAKNASISIENDALKLLPSEDGGTCQLTEVVKRIETANVSATDEIAVRVPMKRIAPTINDADAERLMATVSGHLSDGVELTFGDKTIALEAGVVRSWLLFEVKKDTLVVKIDTKKAKDTLEKEASKAVAKKAGVVTITTKDFIEVSRSGGGDGRTLNIDGTATNIANYLTGEAESAPIATTTIPAQKEYIRNYSPTDTGLSALMKHYAAQHKGTYGASLVELSGERRRAGYNETRKFTTASTYKAYVAYSTLKRAESGALKWNQQIAGGRDLAKCFDDMIVLSDNPCAEALVKKIGYNALHADVQALGLVGTSFIDAESFKTTAGDLSTFMASLESNQLPISKASRDRFIGALKRNVYRQGIPAGTSGSVADKVGFLDGLLHDTAIIYSPKGTYVLTIMTDGSSWGNIAELTREIEKLRAK